MGVLTAPQSAGDRPGMRNVVMEVDRTSTRRTRIVNADLDALAAGSVRFRVERVAVTANTVTYAEMGAMLGYWDFYPTAAATWGRVPAMGWAEVVESRRDGVPVGGRYYGWLPMAGHVDVTVSPTAGGLRDDGPHRSEHAPIYREFAATTADPLYPVAAEDEMVRADLEDRHALLRGLFLTGYLADAFCTSQAWFGAEQVVVLSASSKTAIGFATCVAASARVRVVGVTSPANADFVGGLGIYDEVVTYDRVGGLAVVPSVAVDMAGNGPVLGAVHDRLGDRLAHSMIVGRTHNDAPMAAVVAGPAPEMFFAPTALGQMGQAGTDVAAVMADSIRALSDFVETSKEWLAVERAAGPAATAATWDEVHAGRVPPHIGRVCSLHD